MGSAKIPDEREKDLFGNPVRARKGQRGRPALEITDEQRNLVDAACARGWNNARIADAVGIAEGSLKRHFRDTLKLRDSARDRLELALFTRAVEDALDGNSSAQRTVRETLNRDDLRKREADLLSKQGEKKSSETGSEKLGKKELAKIAAEDAAKRPGGIGGLLPAYGKAH